MTVALSGCRAAGRMGIAMGGNTHVCELRSLLLYGMRLHASIA